MNKTGAGGEVQGRIVGSLADVFEERRREVEQSKSVWRNWFLASILLLFCIALAVFFELAVTASFAAASWLEFAVALPLVYAAVFFHAQHAKAREYLEEYAFKSVVARSIEHARDLLKTEVRPDRAEDEKQVLNFLAVALKDLYTPPREIISKHPVRGEEDVKVGVVEKLGDVFKKFIPGKL